MMYWSKEIQEVRKPDRIDAEAVEGLEGSKVEYGGGAK